ncbi:MAG TPA: phenylalanine--tRNA ligase subunit beta [Acidimicrobiales bacterium]|nr:phenylalanine--tRNA ligase subunit beta [Acidimicrobiales bacterium]
MRAPLSWLRDFAAFPDDVAVLTAALDDLGLVVEGVERIGDGLEDVVVARVEEISAIKGADRIRRIVVDAGGDPLEIVCGAWNFDVGDRVPLAPVGAVLPGGFAISRRTMRGVTSNGMLCSGRELGLSDDAAGLLVLGPEVPGAPGTPIMVALGIETDVVFDITVEGNRPDAWCMAGVARDLAARLGLPFAPAEPARGVRSGVATADQASAVVEAPDLCPRLTVSVLRNVEVLPSPDWLARRLSAAGMRPINNVVDASNYVMLELGQPTHPYDLALLAGPGLVVRRARPGETIETLDGVVRTVGVPGRGLGSTGEDCLICDARSVPVGIAGIMGGSSSEISDTTTAVLLEAAYFTPMAVARTSKALGLRTEASARFERGCDPWGIERSVARLCELLRETVPDLVVCDDALDLRADVPEPFVLEVPIARVRRQIGVPLGAEEMAALIEPVGFACAVDGAGETLSVTVPTNRPDVRPAPYGVDDVIEEVARLYGYSRVPRHTPTWPQPGSLTDLQRSRRAVKEVMCGLGVSEGWTTTFVSEEAHRKVGIVEGRAVRVTNPLTAQEPFLRRSLMPGLLSALSYNAGRRQASVRLFEVGVVFSHPDDGDEFARVVERTGPGGTQTARLPGERELLSAVFAWEDDDARVATAAWDVLAGALGVRGVRLDAVPAAPAREHAGGAAGPGLHPTRSASLVAGRRVIGTVGEIDPRVAEAFDLTVTSAGATRARRIGWLEVDLGLLFDDTVVARRQGTSVALSRFPSSDIDLALVVGDEYPADVVGDVLSHAAGDLLESVTLFDVYRGGAIAPGTRSLAFRLRFCAFDHTLTDEEVGQLRARCILAAEQQVGAVLR